jgi:hypothetical protein
LAEFMDPATALARTVRDDDVPVMLRYKALQALAHPPLDLLRELLVRTKHREKPVPKKLVALASLKYAEECQRRDVRLERRRRHGGSKGKALGI